MADKSIIINEVDYGTFNEQQWKTWCDKSFVEILKKVITGLNSLEVTQEQQTYITNATKINFVDKIDTGTNDTIYIDMVNNDDDIYLFMNDKMVKVGTIRTKIDQSFIEVEKISTITKDKVELGILYYLTHLDGDYNVGFYRPYIEESTLKWERLVDITDTDITEDLIDNAWNKANVSFDDTYNNRVISGKFRVDYNVRCIKTISDKQSEPRKILELPQTLDKAQIVQIEYTTKDGQITCMEDKDTYFNPESNGYIDPNQYDDETMMCSSILVDEDGFAEQTKNKTTGEYNWKYENGIRIPVCVMENVNIDTKHNEPLYKLHNPLTPKELYKYEVCEYESGSDHTQGTKDYYLENNTDLYKYDGSEWSKKPFTVVTELPTPSADTKNYYYICNDILYLGIETIEEGKWYVDTIQAKINTEYLYHLALKQRNVRVNSEGVVGTHIVNNTSENCLDPRGYDGTYSFVATNNMEVTNSTKGMVEGNGLYINGNITLKDFLFKDGV